ncbi:uncharacterized protein LOC127798438 [Diospyros lotus]|uniref:uncharacterized protein LOC127798438 n=1 Tax=Diospyros lotus TaxID=55363 RepID=UPI0022546D23|nr:uncharacterized protein LOC127798438 [Diospyros lotus]
MKRAKPWSDGDDDDSSSDESSTLDTDAESNDGSNKNKVDVSVTSRRPSKEKASEGDSGKRKNRAIDFEALSRHGYKGGLSVLSVPLPQDGNDQKQDWSWSTGKEGHPAKETEETYDERQRTRAAVIEAERLTDAQTQKERKNLLSFAQKEKRKRDLGQASRGKSYVEEEKRLLRESGIYSGFDS